MKAGAFAFLGNYAFLTALAVVASMPFWLPPYYLGVASLALVFIGLSSSWNIVAGIAGQMSLGHSIFVGLGALLSSALLLHFGINMWLGMLISAAASAAVAAFIAWIDFRFRLQVEARGFVVVVLGDELARQQRIDRMQARDVLAVERIRGRGMEGE